LEWDINYAYRGYDAGTNLKSTSGWVGNGNDADLFGFSGLPGGRRNLDSDYDYIGYTGAWWSSTENQYFDARHRNINCYYPKVVRGEPHKDFGNSVRCLRDY